MSTNDPIPVVTTAADVERLAGQTVHVDGVYEQEDVRMMQVGPPEHLGHVVLVLADDCRVFLYPPAQPEARRSAEEIERLEHQRVRALGVILPRIPQAGAVQQAPCLIELQSIELAR